MASTYIHSIETRLRLHVEQEHFPHDQNTI